MGKRKQLKVTRKQIRDYLENFRLLVKALSISISDYINYFSVNDYSDIEFEDQSYFNSTSIIEMFTDLKQDSSNQFSRYLLAKEEKLRKLNTVIIALDTIKDDKALYEISQLYFIELKTIEEIISITRLERSQISKMMSNIYYRLALILDDVILDEEKQMTN